MTLYKLTDSEGNTKNNTHWEIGTTHTAIDNGQPPTLCTSNVIHAYTSLLLAEFMDPIYSGFGSTKLAFVAEGEVIVSDGRTKVGVRSLRIVAAATTPWVTIVQRIAFGILGSLEVCSNPAFKMWAERWLNGTDRTRPSARYAADAAHADAADAHDAAAAAHDTAAAAAYATYYAAGAAAYAAAYAAAAAYDAASAAYEPPPLPPNTSANISTFNYSPKRR